jgi:CheY-like chemotaxis protein
MPSTETATRSVRYVSHTRTNTSAVPPADGTFTTFWGGPFGVLLIEDSDDEIMMVQRTLKRAGLTDNPHVVRDGRAALDMLLGPPGYVVAPSALAEVPDVILLDLGLPKISGLSVLRKIKGNARSADIPVVVLSGADDEGMAQVCMDLGANMYLTKPLSYVEVMNIIVAIQKHWLAAESFRSWTVELSERRAA